MRRRAREIAATLVLVACSSTAGSTVAQPAPVAPTSAPAPAEQTSSTAAPATTSTTTTTTTTTTVAQSDGVPPELLALIGAPMPEVDLTIESEEDVERWLGELFRWNEWLAANPTPDDEVLKQVFTGPYLDRTREGKSRVVAAGILAVGGALEVKSVQINMDNFAVGIISLTVESRRAAPRYTLDAASFGVVDILNADPPELSVISTVVIQAGPDDEWRLVAWQRR